MKLFHYIKYLEGIILDGFFSKKCVGCGSSESWLCLNCRDLAIKGQCSKEVNTDVGEKVWVGFDFENNIIREMMHHLKYNGVIEMANILIGMLSDHITDCFFKEIILAPIPLTSTKMKRRGYNQAELLSFSLSEKYSVCVDKNLIWRVQQGSSQVGLGKEARMANLQGNFILNPKKIELYRNKKIVLVDDVCTTGSTMKICADLFRSNKIFVTCLALAKSL